jgi:hypothetical protein
VSQNRNVAIGCSLYAFFAKCIQNNGIMRSLCPPFICSFSKTKNEPGQLSDTALGSGLDDRGSSPSRSGNSSLHHRIQTGSGAHLASYSMGTSGSFSGGKAAEA